MKLRRKAQKKGADATKITEDSVSWGRWWWYPFFLLSDHLEKTHFFKADLVRFTDVWEKFEISEVKFLAYLNANRETLDPIEGIWIQTEQRAYGEGQSPYKLAIKRDSSKAGRDFVGFIVSGERPGFPQGYKKMDINRSAQGATAYSVLYYDDDFTPIKTQIPDHGLPFSVTLPASTTFTEERFILKKTND